MIFWANVSYLVKMICWNCDFVTIKAVFTKKLSIVRNERIKITSMVNEYATQSTPLAPERGYIFRYKTFISRSQRTRTVTCLCIGISKVMTLPRYVVVIIYVSYFSLVRNLLSIVHISFTLHIPFMVVPCTCKKLIKAVIKEHKRICVH